MTETFYTDKQRDLLRLRWHAFPDVPARRKAVSDLLRTLGSAHSVARVSGGEAVMSDGRTLPIAALESDEADLFELKLDLQPIVYTQDGVVEVIDFDGDELYRLGSAVLEPVADVPVVPGLLGSRVVASPRTLGPESLLFLDGFFGTAPDRGMTLSLRSPVDLWLAVRFDGLPNEPHGRVNAELLVTAFAEVAAIHGAELERLSVLR